MQRARGLTIVLLLAVLLTGCGNDGGQTPSSGGDSTQASDPEPSETTEEKPSACTTKKRGRQIQVLSGKGEGESQFAAYRFYPDRLKLPAGELVTLKVVNPTVYSHTLTIESLNCDTGYIQADGTAFMSFKVPKGVTPFRCLPHSQVSGTSISGMSGELIAR